MLVNKELINWNKNGLKIGNLEALKTKFHPSSTLGKIHIKIKQRLI